MKCLSAKCLSAKCPSTISSVVVIGFHNFWASSLPSLLLILVQTSLKKEKIMSHDHELARHVFCFAINAGNPSGFFFGYFLTSF